MIPKPEILQDALKYQQRYLSFLSRIDRRVILGIGMTVGALSVAAFHLIPASGPRPGSLYILVGVLGGVIVVVILMGGIWLCREIAKRQLASYEKAIQKLDREE